LTSSASQDVDGNYFVYNTTSFSGFSIREVVSSSSSGGSSGGSGGGGACAVGYESVDGLCKLIEVPEIIENETLEEGIPEQLFDIRTDLESKFLENSNELELVVTYESFGSMPTPVNLTFEIYDMSGNLVYEKFENILVFVEEIERYTFDDLNLPAGDYEIVFTTLYNVDVVDDLLFKKMSLNSFSIFIYL